MDIYLNSFRVEALRVLVIMYYLFDVRLYPFLNGISYILNLKDLGSHVYEYHT